MTKVRFSAVVHTYIICKLYMFLFIQRETKGDGVRSVCGLYVHLNIQLTIRCQSLNQCSICERIP